jgi:ATP-dependent exoDNAse (exonuclease V) alpha subunit
MRSAELAEVRRQHKNDDRRAAELMAEGNFHGALGRYDAKGAIHWTRTQNEAREALVDQWAKDNAADSSKSRFVFAYTNADVDLLNRDIRQVRKQAGELEGQDHTFETKHGRAEFSAGDRVQFTGTDKPRGLYNGQAGTVQAIDGSKFTVRLDGRGERSVEFDAEVFQDFRHGYAGTIYKGQGRTLDQTYLYHSEHWRSAASYVALTRHRDKAELFVARNSAPDLKELARQMARVDDRRAASRFHQSDERAARRPLTPRELAARFSDPAMQRRHERQEVAQRQQAESDARQQPAIESAARAERERKGEPSRPGEIGTAAERRLARLLNSLEQEDTNKRDNQGSRTPGGRSRTR